MANLDSTFSSPLQAHVLNDIAGDTPAIRWSELKQKWPHLCHVPFESVSKRRQIDIMIGSDHPVFHHVLKEACGDQPNDPVARLTNLGWVCFGPTLVEEFRLNTHSHFTRTYRSSQVNKSPPPDDILRAFWELESLGITDQAEQQMTAEEKAAVAQVAETLEFESGRYKIGIPWKEGEPKLANNYEDAQHLRRQLSDLLAMAGFRLRKWSSSEPVVIEDIPEEDRLPTLAINKDDLPKTKTLGVMWEAQRDVFTFQVEQPLLDSKKPTKRNVLSAIASLFDPLQFLAPFTVRAKILMQEIWMAGIDWDDVLPENLKVKWEKWVAELPQLSNVTVPRCLHQANPANVELHLFSDASNDAFAAVAYLVCRYLDGDPSSRLIASKCRVSPVKVMTIPRLELMGAVLSSRLAQNIQKVITVDRTVFWTDSENVWYWVRNQSREFKPFVANRVGEIQRTTSPEQWRHVPGTINPADLPTRGLSATALAESKVWLEGPAFLKDKESTWPAAPPPRDNTKKTEDCERRTVTRTHMTKSHVSEIIDLNKFSSLKRLVRVTGWFHRFLTNCRLSLNSRRKDRILLPIEISKAETMWIKQAQTQAFPGGESEESLTRLNPKCDGEGLLRMDGRLRFADHLPYDTRHPILLPKDHAVTRLVIVDAHERLGHGTGVEHVLTELRSRFWIVKGRHMVRNVIESCTECRRRFSTKIGNQMMAPLPKSRLQSSLRAFEKVGIDYGGPFLTKQGRGKTRAKRYLCLFTCLTT